MLERWLLVKIVVCGAACSRPAVQSAPVPKDHARSNETSIDPHSRANPADVRVRHVGFDWAVSFETRSIGGTATYWLERRNADSSLVLDTRDLLLEKVDVARLPTSAAASSSVRLATADDLLVSWQPAVWSEGPPDSLLGRALTVELPVGADLVRVTYRTTADAGALQWLAPEQTAGGEQPFLYTQSQAILARTWWPSQDTPQVRITFDAEITVDRPLRPLMSARDETTPDRRVGGPFRFVMPEPIPAYLVALAVGSLEFRELGNRTGVWAEPSVVQAAARELVDLEAMLSAAESLYGPYRWERYDVLILPPAFPFGGMENPRLTFVTPTIIAGDRSLVSVVAHELAHSWSGNLATNATWNDLWLNEGFTTYMERRLIEVVFGPERAEMELLLGLEDLEADLADAAREPALQRLDADLAGRDPDDGMTAVPYEKGAAFLRELEHGYGRERFDAFVRAWFDEHSFTSVTTGEFERFLATRLTATPPLAGRVAPDVRAWLEEPGLPYVRRPRAAAFERVAAQADAFIGGHTTASKLATDSWSTQQWLHFLDRISLGVDARAMAELDDKFALTRAGNQEILARWLVLAVRKRHLSARSAVERFLATVGRRKYLVPLYKAIVDTDGRDVAREIYGRFRGGYHPVTRQAVDAIVGWGR